MQVFLLWHREGAAAAPAAPAAAKALAEVFAPLFATPPQQTVHADSPAASAVSISLPVEGWTAAEAQADAHGWRLCLDYPWNLPTVAAELAPAGGTLLARLAAGLQSDPQRWLQRLSPPYGLIWQQAGSEAIRLQSDGLGCCQLYEYRRGGMVAYSNRIHAFRALGLPVEPDEEQWGIRAAIGWFPAQTTGYRDIRFLEPGEQVTLSAAGVASTRFDVIGRWLGGPTLSPQQALELARESIVSHIRDASITWPSAPKAGLTGGRDSRAIAATLLHEGIVFSPRVRGRQTSYDVIVAQQLARRANLSLTMETDTALPPHTPEALARSLSLATLWQAGHVEPALHKMFLATEPHLTGGGLNIMGQHGEIGRAFYAGIMGVDESTAGATDLEAKLFAYLSAAAGPYLQPHVLDAARGAFSQQYRLAARHGLSGLDALDFFYLYERTRRWASGGLALQPGVVFAPFLNPDFVRAVFASPWPQRRDGAFHRHIVASHFPAWTDVPYEKDLRLADRQRRLARRGVLASAESLWASLRSRLAHSWHSRDGADFDAYQYWRHVVAPLVRQSTRHDGLWSRIFLPPAVRQHSFPIADLLTVMGAV